MPGRPELLTGSRCPARGRPGRAGQAPLRSVNTATSVCGPPASPPGPPSETPGSSFPKHAQVYIPGQPLQPQPGPQDPREPEEACCPEPGAWRCLTRPGILPVAGSDDTGLELSQHHLPGIPCAVRGPGSLLVILSLPMNPVPTWLLDPPGHPSVMHLPCMWRLGVLGIGGRAPEAWPGLPLPLCCHCVFPCLPFSSKSGGAGGRVQHLAQGLHCRCAVKAYGVGG